MLGQLSRDGPFSYVLIGRPNLFSALRAGCIVTKEAHFSAKRDKVTAIATTDNIMRAVGTFGSTVRINNITTKLVNHVIFCLSQTATAYVIGLNTLITYGNAVYG